MEQGERSDKRNIIKTLLVYLGGALVFIEAINFLINKYDWITTNVGVLIPLVIFGLPARQAVQEGRALKWEPMTKTIKAV